MYRQHPADSMSRRFGPRTGPLSSYNKSAHNLTSKFLYINTQYLGQISILGMTPTQPQWKGAHEVPDVLKGGRFHRLSSLRFIPRGNDVPRVLIHRFYLILCRQGSWLRAHSITMTNMSARVCGPLLKCNDTGDSSVVLCAMSNQWLLTLRWNDWPVSRTYCWPHLLHVIKYITLEHLQGAWILTLKDFPAVWLENSSEVTSMGRVLHLGAPQGYLPGGLRGIDVRATRTRKSFRFLGWRKAISGGSRNASHVCSETWRIGRCLLVVEWRDGKKGW